MSNGRVRSLSLLVLAATALSVVRAKEPAAAPALAPAPGTAAFDCTDALADMSTCLTYVEEGANLTVPEKGCCPSLGGLVNSHPICLCHLLSSGEVFGIKIDETKALSLPTICHVQTPPVSLCRVLGIPVPSQNAVSPGSGAVAPATETASPPSDNGCGSNAGGPALLVLLAVAGEAVMMF